MNQKCTHFLFYISAYRALDAQLDQLNSVLDSLEEKTDSIQQRAKDLLKSNRELRGGNNAQEAMDQDQPPDESD